MPSRRQPHREQPRRHRQPGLAHAVLAAVDRRHLRRHRRHEDDAGRERRGPRAGVRPVARDRLRQEVRALQVRAQHFLEAVLRRVEEIGADPRRAAGVVDERVQRAAAVTAGFRDERRAIVAPREIGRDVVDVCPRLTQLVEDASDVRLGPRYRRARVPARRARARARSPSPMPRVPPVTSAVRVLIACSPLRGPRRLPHSATPRGVRRT